MPFSFFKMSTSQKPTGAYSRPRTGSSYTSRKIYKTDEKGRRVVAGTTVGTYDKRKDKIVYNYRPVVERRKPTMSNFLAALFKPAIDKKIAEGIAKVTKPLGGRVTERDEVEIDISDIAKGKQKEKVTVTPTPDFLAEQKKRQQKAKEAFEKKRREMGLMAEGTDIQTKIDSMSMPGALSGFGTNISITDLRFNSGR